MILVKKEGEVKITVKMSNNVIRNYITNYLKLYIVTDIYISYISLCVYTYHLNETFTPGVIRLSSRAINYLTKSQHKASPITPFEILFPEMSEKM